MSASKLFNDPIHGTIKLDPFLVKIIDTPEFQRLRHIKQLGGVYYVYPEAQHNRFEHSIGTAHLAGKLVEHLTREQPKLNITNQEVLCVKVAGLCHDLGHGPFSHLFDGMFLPKCGVENWTHEQGSCDIFDRLITRLDPDNKKLSIEDRKFIKEMINGKEMGTEWTHEGRGEEKSFLYEIISNKTNGIDVDKWDYFARDCYHLGITCGFDHNRLIECTKVLDVSIDDCQEMKRKRICYRDKEEYDLYEMFHARFSLHKRAYQHKGANAINLMIRDVLCEADEYIDIPDGGGEHCHMSSCVEPLQLGSYCNLDDRILQIIEWSGSRELAPARAILKRLSNGDRYRCIGSKVCDLKSYSADEKTKLKREIASTIADGVGLHGILKLHIEVFIVTINYGKRDQNPLDYCWFYSKRDPDTPIKMEKEGVSLSLPSRFQEDLIQAFCTKEMLTQQEREEAENAFKDVMKTIA